MRKTKRNFKEAPGRARTDEGRRWKAAGTASVAVLAALNVVAIGPLSGISTVQAADGGNPSPDDLPSGAQIDLNSTKDVQSEVTLTMDSGGTNGKLNASAATTNPDAAADVVKRTATVGLTNTDGYVVNIKANSTNLTGTNTSNTIASVSANSTLGQMTNTWGWNGSVGDAVADCNPSGTFKPMKTTDQELGTGGAIAATQNKKVTMCFGSRIDGSKVADTYSNIVTLSVVAQPGKTATFGGKTTMQEITPAICKAADINDTAYLRDTRDNKYYWVTKLLDGNCWMSQNLALDLSTGTALTSATSDVSSSWTPGRTTVNISTSNPLSSSNTSTSNTETYSWDLGDYVIIDPTATTACSDNATGLSACSGQFMAVGSRTASTDPNFYKNNGNKTYTATEYDAHYLAGNYYQWNAATAGTGGTITNANASGSICPKNWKLPNSRNVSRSGFFYFLLSQYGVSGSLEGTSSVNGNTYNIALSPLFITRSGYIWPGYTPPFRSAGQEGSLWSSLAYSEAGRAYFLNVNNSGVGPSNSGGARNFGRSVRCFVPTT